MDLIAVTDVVLTAVIAFIALWAYLQNRSQVALLLGVAFAFFVVSHLLNLAFGYDAYANVIEGLQVVAYLLLIVGAWRLLKS